MKSPSCGRPSIIVAEFDGAILSIFSKMAVQGCWRARAIL